MKHQIFIYLAFFVLIATLSCNTTSTPEEEPEIERSYTKSIERNYSNDFERALIDSAEAAYPPRDSVLKAASEAGFTPTQNETELWFYNQFDGIYIPYAITKNAINYYSGLIESFLINPEEQSIVDANFQYVVNINFHENYRIKKPSNWPDVLWQDKTTLESDQFFEETLTDVYVIDMYVEWKSYCGEKRECAVIFRQGRISIFNQAGDSQRIYFDGKIPLIAS